MSKSEYEKQLYSQVFVRMRPHPLYGGYVPECDTCAGTTDNLGGAVMLPCWRCGFEASREQFASLLQAAGASEVGMPEELTIEDCR